MPQSPLLWPERQRCVICRKRFRWVVIRQRYCSYDCAGLEEPDPRVFPRSCFNRKYPGENVPRAKTTYFSFEVALGSDPRKRDPTLEPYWCDHCHMVHLGHAPQPEIADSPEPPMEAVPSDPVVGESPTPVPEFIPDPTYTMDWIYITRRKKADRRRRRLRPSETPPPYPREYRRM